MAKRWGSKNLKAKAAEVAAAGRRGADGRKDTEIVHLRKDEVPIVDRALKRYGGEGSTNPKTGKKEYKYGADTGEGHGPDRTFGSGAFGGRGGKSTGSGSKDQSIPPTQASPTGRDESLGASGAALGGASEPLGGTSAPGAPTDLTPSSTPPAGTRPMSQYRPGDVPYRKGADILGIGATALGGIGGAVARGLEQGLTGKDSTESLLGEHLGKQVGWSGTGEERGSRPGKSGGKLGDTTVKTASTPAPTPSSTSTSGSAAVAADTGGGTITVNPDGTVRTKDTSVAGLRAQRRYGAKTTGATA